nr:MAG TPA: hypothetical protein [Ackermannviridae sp.]
MPSFYRKTTLVIRNHTCIIAYVDTTTWYLM